MDLKIVDFELKKLAGRYMELRDGRLRMVGWPWYKDRRIWLVFGY